MGGPEVGFTLLKNHCYMIPKKLALVFAQQKWVELGKIDRLKEFQPRIVKKGRRVPRK